MTNIYAHCWHRNEKVEKDCFKNQGWPGAKQVSAYNRIIKFPLANVDKNKLETRRNNSRAERRNGLIRLCPYKCNVLLFGSL